MSLEYWGIVIGLATLVVMLLACMTMLNPKGGRDQKGTKQSTGRSVDVPIPPSVTSRRAA
jgi:hypothetical protein